MQPLDLHSKLCVCAFSGKSALTVQFVQVSAWKLIQFNYFVHSFAPEAPVSRLFVKLFNKRTIFLASFSHALIFAPSSSHETLFHLTRNSPVFETSRSLVVARYQFLIHSHLLSIRRRTRRFLLLPCVRMLCNWQRLTKLILCVLVLGDLRGEVRPDDRRLVPEASGGWRTAVYAGDPRHGRHRAVYSDARSLHEEWPGLHPRIFNHSPIDF